MNKSSFACVLCAVKSRAMATKEVCKVYNKVTLVGQRSAGSSERLWVMKGVVGKRKGETARDDLAWVDGREVSEMRGVGCRVRVHLLLVAFLVLPAGKDGWLSLKPKQQWEWHLCR